MIANKLRHHYQKRNLNKPRQNHNCIKHRYNDKLKARIETMKMREDDLSSFYQGVKAVLKANGQQLQGIHGAVAQQIDVPSKYTKAIETALGASMQHVIVSDEAAARQAIQF